MAAHSFDQLYGCFFQSGEYYRERFETAREKVKALVGMQEIVGPLPTDLSGIAGEWELVFTTVKHGIFRSSPFFLAIQEAFGFAEEKEVSEFDLSTISSR